MSKLTSSGTNCIIEDDALFESEELRDFRFVFSSLFIEETT
jgi:hypothetical protein